MSTNACKDRRVEPRTIITRLTDPRTRVASHREREEGLVVAEPILYSDWSCSDQRYLSLFEQQVLGQRASLDCHLHCERRRFRDQERRLVLPQHCCSYETQSSTVFSALTACRVRRPWQHDQLAVHGSETCRESENGKLSSLG